MTRNERRHPDRQQRIRCHNEGNVNRHPERMRRIYTRGEESGKKIKAVSCELSAAS